MGRSGDDQPRKFGATGLRAYLFSGVVASVVLVCGCASSEGGIGSPMVAAKVACPKSPFGGELLARQATSPCPVELWLANGSLTLTGSVGDGKYKVIGEGRVPNNCVADGLGSCRMEWQIDFVSPVEYAIWAEEFYGGAFESASRQLWFGHPVTSNIGFVALWPGEEEFAYSTPSGSALALTPMRCRGGLFFKPGEREPSRLTRAEPHFSRGWWYGADLGGEEGALEPSSEGEPGRNPKVAMMIPEDDPAGAYRVSTIDALGSRSCRPLRRP